MKKLLLFLLFLSLTSILTYYFFPEKNLPSDVSIDSIVVYKSKHTMEVYASEKLLKTYCISIGKNPVGDKQFEGDLKTPEGHYAINSKNPNSTCYKNLGISYPNAQDIAEAKQLGKPTGGDIKIHGIINGSGFIGKFYRWFDWTNGCIAVTDSEMDELYRHVPVGTPIEIFP